MPRPSQAAKDAAFRNQEVASGVATTSGVAAAGVALIPGVGPFIALGAAGVGAIFGIRAIKLGRIAHDPPRDDYSEPTTLPPSRVDVSVLGDSPTEVAAAGLIDANDQATRAFDAIILALERASGAELAGDDAMLEARAAEVFEFAAQASDALIASSERTGPFRDALAEFRDVSTPPFQPGTTLESLLPEPTLSAWDALGLPRDYLRAGIDRRPTERPVEALSDALGQTAESDYEFAQYLQSAVRDQTLLQPGVS